MTLSDRIWRETGWSALDEESADEMVAVKLQPPDAVSTGFPSWDRVCRDEGGGEGIARGWHVTVGAGSGKGKSLIGANLARAAIERGEHVGKISLEMSMAQLDTRSLAIISGEPIRELEQGGGFREATLRRAHARVQEIARTTGGRIYRNPELLRDIKEIEGAIEFLRNGPAGCRFFVIDYIQLAGDPNEPKSITDVSHRIRQLARDLDVITVCLSQFNRDSFKRGGRPSIHDLTGGSAIENDSDQVLVLDHTATQRAPAPFDGWDSVLIVDKNRHGPSVSVPIRFDSRTLRFRELMPDELPATAAR